jgi:hypothetical protein
MNFPLLLSAALFALMTLAIWLGVKLRNKGIGKKEEERADAAVLGGAIFTLLFFIIGFSFSMAINRYDLRKNCEQAEAVAIGTAYSRADLLAPADAVKIQTLLKKYLDQRILFYSTRSSSRASEISAETVRLQAELWSTVRPAIASIPAPLMGLLVTGVNDVVNSQRSSQSAWLNRIPFGAWAMIAMIGTGSCWLIGYRGRRTDWLAFMLVPTMVSVCIFMISDIDSPRGGTILVTPQNLSILLQSLPPK